MASSGASEGSSAPKRIRIQPKYLGGGASGSTASASAPAPAAALPPPLPKAPAPSKVQDDEAESSDPWVKDDDGRELVTERRDTGHSLATLLQHGKAVWQHVVHCRIERVALDGEYAVLAAGNELHLLSAKTGLTLSCPVLLGTVAVHLQVQDGRLIVLGRDASLRVFDLFSRSLVTETSLKSVCAPTELKELMLRKRSAEPVLRLHSGSLLVFNQQLKHWVTIRPPMDVSDAAGGAGATSGTNGAQASFSTATRPRDLLSLEADILSAACCGLTEDFQEKLRAMVKALAYLSSGPGRPDPQGRLRAWSMALMGQSHSKSPTALPWLAAALEQMELEGKDVLQKVMLPALKALPAPKGVELRVELEAYLQSQEAARASRGAF